MANRVTVAEIDNRSVVAATSRYATSQILYYGDENKITFETFKRTEIPEGDGDRFTVVTQPYRPDLLSQEAYGTPDFWWKIMQANQIWDIWDFKAGINIRLPDDIYSS
jgi:hypothetical protein